MKSKSGTVFLLTLLGVAMHAKGLETQAVIRIAVAANFKTTLEKIIAHTLQTNDFDSTKIKLSSGATGSLYTQILYGAPYDIFFAADTAHPIKLIEQELALPTSYREYAMGQLILAIKRKADLAVSSRCSTDVLNDYLIKQVHRGEKFIVANPRIAPYGHAAKDYLQQKIYGFLPNSEKADQLFIQAKNIVHAQHLFLNTNTNTAFLAKSHWLNLARATRDQFIQCEIQLSNDRPLTQAAVIVKNKQRNLFVEDQLRKIMAILASKNTRQLISDSGYLLPQPGL